MAQDGKFNTPLKIALATPSACNNYERYFKRNKFQSLGEEAILMGGLNFTCYSTWHYIVIRSKGDVARLDF